MKIAKRGFVSEGTYQLNDTSYQFLRKKEKKGKKKKNEKRKKKRVSDTRWISTDREPKLKYNLQFLSRRSICM